MKVSVSRGFFERRVQYAPVFAAALLLAGCVPTLPTVGVATSGAEPITSHYLCPIDGAVTVSRNVADSTLATSVVLTTSFGSEAFYGAFPVYYGEEASLTFDSGSNVMIVAAPGEQQTCVTTDLG